MKVLYFAKNYHPAHAGVVAAIQSEGHDVVLVVHTEKSGSVKNGESLTPVRIVVLERWNLLTRLFRSRKTAQAFPNLFWVRQLIRRERPGLVLVYSHHYSGVLISLLARLSGARSATIADSPRVLKRLRRLPWLLLQRPFRNQAQLHTGEYGRPGESVHLGPMLGQSFVAPYPVKVDISLDRRLEEPDEAAPKKVRLVCMSCSNPRRARIDLPVRALAKSGVAEQIELVFLRASSHGEVPLIRRLESELGVPRSQIRLDLSDNEVREFFMSSADAMIYPAHNVDYGQTVAEALAHGLPVLCSDSVGARLLVEHGTNGLVFSSDNVDALAAVLKEVVESGPRRLSEMSTSAKQIAARTHSSEAWMATLSKALA